MPKRVASACSASMQCRESVAIGEPKRPRPARNRRGHVDVAREHRAGLAEPEIAIGGCTDAATCHAPGRTPFHFQRPGRRADRGSAGEHRRLARGRADEWRYAFLQGNPGSTGRDRARLRTLKSRPDLSRAGSTWKDRHLPTPSATCNRDDREAPPDASRAITPSSCASISRSVIRTIVQVIAPQAAATLSPVAECAILSWGSRPASVRDRPASRTARAPYPGGLRRRPARRGRGVP